MNKYLDIDKFASVINCMDGRTQLPVLEWIINNYDIDYPDIITEAGPIKIISENTNEQIIEAIKYRLDISINKHHSKHIFIVAHYDCAGNPEQKARQIEQLKKSMQIVKSWGYNVKEITGLWVNENWQVEMIEQMLL
jgi:carbonic anhydrase